MKNALLLLLLFAISSLPAQTKMVPVHPKREFRAVWVATVSNIDFPAPATADRISLQEQYRKLVERFKDMGFNAMIVQVRPSGDALYPTELAPPSRYLTGKEGIPPSDNFDMLQFMVEESHRAGMEFHAWFNPYRATFNMDTLSLSEKHAFHRNRDWLVQYGTRYYFNPALEEVRLHLTDVVAEVVRKYDIDAVHFDDYFYPYKIKGLPFADSTYYLADTSRQFFNIEDWRRAQVDSLIYMVHRTVKAIKPNMRFGISPFGVWRNSDRDPRGSNTRAGQTCYDDLYADVLKWMQEGWIDYVMPQLYWNIGFAPADHATLLDWWTRNSNGVPVFIGHSVYKIAADKELAWNMPDEISRQILLNRANQVAKGSAFFSARSFNTNPLGIVDTLKQHFYEYPSLMPLLKEDRSELHRPRLKKVKNMEGQALLRWKANYKDRKTMPEAYAIYRFKGENPGNYEDARNLLGTVRTREIKTKWLDPAIEEAVVYNYVVTPIDGNHAEGEPSKSRAAFKEGGEVTKWKVKRNWFDWLPWL